MTLLVRGYAKLVNENRREYWGASITSDVPLSLERWHIVNIVMYAQILTFKNLFRTFRYTHNNNNKLPVDNVKDKFSKILEKSY